MQNLTDQEAFQLGVDAYVYGYPLLVMDSVTAINECGFASGQAGFNGTICSFSLVS